MNEVLIYLYIPSIMRSPGLIECVVENCTSLVVSLCFVSFVSFVCFAVEEGVCVSQTHSLPAFDLSLLKFVIVDCSVGCS